LRLEKLKVKIECVNNVFEETEKSLVERIKSKPEDYKKVMKNLIIQGLIKLLEDNVNIVCRKEDVELIKQVKDQAKSEFLDLLNKESNKFKGYNVNITIDSKYFLPSNIIGGVMLTGLKSRIRVDNTLNKRLELVKQQSTPEIRKLLFKNT
jgi:V-type H+-transporting ATPase subunit E